MKTKVLVVMLAVASGIAIRATSQIAAANAKRAAFATQRDEWLGKTDALKDRLRRAKDTITETEKSEAALTKNTAAAKNSAVSASAQPSDTPTRTVRKLSPASLVANDPVKMAEYTKNYRASLDLTLGGVVVAGLGGDKLAGRGTAASERIVARPIRHASAIAAHAGSLDRRGKP
ncbi:MAG: hypothetical protein Q7S40_04370 [Opitutaceae bacterium]|nr:hypothetical protein [Opitutaceae bacterium]